MKNILLCLITISFAFSGCLNGKTKTSTTEKNTADTAAENSIKSEPNAKTGKKEKMLTIKLKTGDVKIKLFPEVAPKHVERITTLAKEGFYDGIVFHRVIDGFMAQTGDPTGTGAGGSKLPDLDAEFSDAPFKRGTLGMARTQDPNSANSQFFIVLDQASHLNGQYTVFGEVTEGMEHVDQVKKGDPANNGLVDEPDKMISVTL